MDPEVRIALIAAVVAALIGGFFAMIGTDIQHFLNLREHRLKKELDRAEKDEQKRLKIRQHLEVTRRYWSDRELEEEEEEEEEE